MNDIFNAAAGLVLVGVTILVIFLAFALGIKLCRWLLR